MINLLADPSDMRVLEYLSTYVEFVSLRFPLSHVSLIPNTIYSEIYRVSNLLS